jgi:phage terminase small subunit
MGILANPRHERFVQALFEGETADAAYAKAGYKPNDGNCIRLKGNERVKARLAELQAQTAEASKITVESICRELDEANAVAKAKGQAAAMVSAATLRAKLAGLMVERVEVGDPGDFAKCEGMADIVDEVLARLIEQFRPVDEQDRQGLLALYERHLKETDEYIEAIKARPIVAERVDARRLDRPWQHLRPRHPAIGESPAEIRNKLINKRQPMLPPPGNGSGTQ